MFLWAHTFQASQVNVRANVKPHPGNVSNLLYDRVVTRRAKTTLETDFAEERVNKQVVYRRSRSGCRVEMKKPNLLWPQCLPKWLDHTQFASDAIPEQQGYYIEMNLSNADVHFQRKLTNTLQEVYFSVKEFFIRRPVPLWLKKLTAVPPNIKTPQTPYHKLATKTRQTRLRNGNNQSGQ